MTLRIIAGELGGRFIDAPRGPRTRPTAERVREAWFSALAGDVDGARVADLYAGSGALGIEALSRGATHVHFVESDRRAVALLHRNVATLDLADRSRVVRDDAVAWVDRLDEPEDSAGPGAPLDLVLADPPYASTGGARLVERFRARPFASQLWVEHGPDAEWAAAADWTRAYGDTCVSRFRAAAGASTRTL
ncbi:16S rRNA (guanine(966)-N(2))-methyltransferase RsmD [Candidatus Palauibacter sp.]|uniref:16S rRNA (guanine(966)-N(2))-methyltransferase RsmD n=1 Tax=Candidatus Palauibacter sp. TaxID=3101350 RepID=UPI003B5254FC